MRGNVIETVLGAVVIVVAAFFLVFAYTSANLRTVKGYALEARFASAAGLNTGADVRISGIKVGTVTEQHLDPQSFQAVVRLQLQNDVKLPLDSTAAIATEGLLGATYLQLQPGGDSEMLKPGATIEYTQSAISLQDLIGRFMFSSGSGSGSGAGAGAGGAGEGAAAAPMPAAPGK
jgi:phospholipid/cholesterol/gamma-HCH transport system substrate-binding protein